MSVTISVLDCTCNVRPEKSELRKNRNNLKIGGLTTKKSSKILNTRRDFYLRHIGEFSQEFVVLFKIFFNVLKRRLRSAFPTPFIKCC